MTLFFGGMQETLKKYESNDLYVKVPAHFSSIDREFNEGIDPRAVPMFSINIPGEKGRKPVSNRAR